VSEEAIFVHEVYVNQEGYMTQRLYSTKEEREWKISLDAKKTTALIATGVDIKRLIVGGLIQSFIQIRTKGLHM
jgi:hypothetical protein